MASAQAETNVGLASEQGPVAQRQRKGTGSGADSPKSNRSSPTQQEEKRIKSEDRTSPTGGAKDEDKESQGHAVAGGEDLRPSVRHRAGVLR